MPASIYCFDGWRLVPGRRQLFRPDGSEVRLTSHEIDMMIAFCEHPQQILTRMQLVPRIAGRVFSQDRAVDVRVARIRRKIEIDPREPEIIKTIRQNGYWFAPEVSTE
jgi:two-component system, OmpR family, response regulator